MFGAQKSEKKNGGFKNVSKTGESDRRVKKNHRVS